MYTRGDGVHGYVRVILIHTHGYTLTTYILIIYVLVRMCVSIMYYHDCGLCLRSFRKSITSSRRRCKLTDEKHLSNIFLTVSSLL
jgi:hypothetical protein